MKEMLLKPTALFALAVMGAGAVVMNPAKAHAVGGLPTVNIYVDSVSMAAPAVETTGYLDVYVTVPVGLSVSQFAADLNLDSTAGVSLSGADQVSTDRTNIVLPGGVFSDTVVSASEVSASESSSTEGTLHSNMDLFRVQYTIEPTAAGVYNVTLNSLLTNVSDGSLSYPVVVHPGTITVTPSNGTAVVPEPASLSLLAVGAVGLVMRRRLAK